VCVQKTLWQNVPIHIHECNLLPEKTCKGKFQVLHTCVESIVHQNIDIYVELWSWCMHVVCFTNSLLDYFYQD